MKKKPTITSPEDEPGPSCFNAYPDFPELPAPHLISQSELKDLVRDLSILNIQAELLASLPQGWNLLQLGFRVPYR
jgi:hypothetical protein